MRFLRSEDVAAGMDHGLLLAKRCGSDALVGYSPRDKRYASQGDVDLFASVDVALASGGTVRCKTALTLYRELCEEYTPERIASLCWIAKEQVTATARILYESRPVCYYLWTGTGQHTNASQTDRAIAIVMALTGSFDGPGGNVDFARPPAKDVSGAELLSPAQRAKCVELSKSPLGPGRNAWITSDSLYTAILDKEPYAIRGMVGFGRNFLVSHGNAGRGVEAFKQLEFYVHMDVVASPTASYADVFLPINTPWEREALRVGFEGSQAAENLIQLRQAAIESRGESRSDGYVVFELAKRLGLGHLFWDGSIEAGMNHILEPLGLTVEELRKRPQGVNYAATTQYFKHRKNGFKTHTGKIEIYSEVFRDAGQNPLPDFVEPALSPLREGSTEFPLVLTSAKVVQFCHSQHRDVPSLRRRSPDPEVQMHPDAAGERGIEDGMMVELRTHLGSVRMRAKLDASLDARVVWAQYGWWAGNQTLGLPAWSAFSEEGANINRLISDAATDPISGSVAHRSSLCDVQPAPGADKRAWVGWRQFRVATIRTEADGIKSFVLRPVDGQPLPAYIGGQHVNVRVKAAHGATVVRCYSLCGGDDAHAYRISVKRSVDPQGRIGQASGALHHIELGTRVELQAPKGKFHLPVDPGNSEHSRPVVMVAGGIGITPFMAMLCQLRERPRAGKVRLVYGVRSAADHAFKAEILDLKRALPQLETCIIEGNLSVDVILRGHGADADFYLCGPPAMVEMVSDALRAAEVLEDRIHLEAFGPSSRPANIEHHGPQPIRLTKSGKAIIWMPGQGSLLNQLEKTGAPLGSGCRTGQCESCAMDLVRGQVAHPEGCAQVDPGRCLPCVAVPLTPIELDG
jgi:ferredoxin-NADP reductase